MLPAITITASTTSRARIIPFTTTLWRTTRPRPSRRALVAPPLAAQALPLGLAFPHIAPLPDNKGDEDGLSEDVNDCNKGCIDGNPE